MSSQMSHICQNCGDLSIFTPPIGPANFEVEQQVDTLNCWDLWGIFEESAGPADVVFMMSFPTCFFWLNLKLICGSSDVKQIWSSIHVIISQDDGSSSRWNTEEKQLFICINMIFLNTHISALFGDHFNARNQQLEAQSLWSPNESCILLLVKWKINHQLASKVTFKITITWSNT